MEAVLKKLVLFTRLFKHLDLKNPRVKSLGIVAVVAAVAVFGLLATIAVIGSFALYQLASNTNIALDINQFFGDAQLWLAELLGVGQGAIQDVQRTLDGSAGQT